MFKQFGAIAGNTFTETIRQPIFIVLVLSGAGLLALNPALSAFSLESGKDIAIMTDVGLATLLLYGLIAAAFSATSVITREIESQTVLTVISKPVPRPVFIVGKYAGVGAALLVGYYFLCLVFLMTVRHGVMETNADKFDWPVLLFSIVAVLISLLAATFGNYVYGWHFATTLMAFLLPTGTLALLLVLGISKTWELQPVWTDFGDLQLLFAIAAIFLAVLVLTAFAVAMATRFSQLATLLLCIGVLVIGLLSDHLIGQRIAESRLHSLLYAIVPNFQFFWLGDALTQKLTIPFEQVGRVASYAGLYTLAVLGAAVALFQTREVS